SPLGLKYERVKDNIYVITPPEEPSNTYPPKKQGSRGVWKRNTNAPLLTRASDVALEKYLFSNTESVLNIRGRVTSEAGESLVGASVLLKGTTIGTTTDVNGYYTFDVPDPNGTLVFSYIGYNSLEVPINNRQIIDVALIADVRALQEV